MEHVQLTAIDKTKYIQKRSIVSWKQLIVANPY